MSTHELFQLCCCQFGGTRTLRILPKKYHHFAKANLRKHLQSHLSHQWPKLRQLLGNMVLRFWWVLSKEVPKLMNLSTFQYTFLYQLYTFTFIIFHPSFWHVMRKVHIAPVHRRLVRRNVEGTCWHELKAAAHPRLHASLRQVRVVSRG